MKNKKEKRNDYFCQRGFTAQFRAAGADGENTGHIVEGLAAVYEQETRIADIFGEFIEIIREGAFDETDFSSLFIFPLLHIFHNQFQHSRYF